MVIVACPHGNMHRMSAASHDLKQVLPSFLFLEYLYMSALNANQCNHKTGWYLVGHIISKQLLFPIGLVLYVLGILGH